MKALATLTGYWGKQIAFEDIVTASKPYPHVLYVVELVLKGTHIVIEQRYSEVRVYFNISLHIF